MIAKPCFHRRRHAQTLVNPAEVVVHVMERNGVLQILDLFGERISQSSKPAHTHSHRQILALCVAGRNVVVVGIAADHCPPRAHTLRGRIASVRLLRDIAVKFNQHCVVDLGSESLVNRDQIRLVAVSRQLYSIGKALLQIAEEMIASRRVARADEPTRDEFRIRVKRNPSPSIPAALGSFFGRAVLFLGINKRPDFITLDTAAFQVAKLLVLIIGASATEIAEKFDDSILGSASHSDGGADAVSLDQAGNDRRLLLGAQFIHVAIMLERSSSVNKKVNFFATSKYLQRLQDWCLTCFQRRKEGVGWEGIRTPKTRGESGRLEIACNSHSATHPQTSFGDNAGDLVHHRRFTFLRSSLMRPPFSPRQPYRSIPIFPSRNSQSVFPGSNTPQGYFGRLLSRQPSAVSESQVCSVVQRPAVARWLLHRRQNGRTNPASLSHETNVPQARVRYRFHFLNPIRLLRLPLGCQQFCDGQMLALLIRRLLPSRNVGAGINKINCRINFFYYFLFQRDFAAFCAICFRFLGERAAALALPPFRPPSFPSATAAGFFGFSPVDSALILAAI